MNLTAEHNLTEEELVKALRGLADAEGIAEDLVKALRRGSIDDTPKVPKHPATRHLYDHLMAEFRQAAEDIERYAQAIQEHGSL